MAMIPFVKMHGIGNDYVYVDAVTRPEFAARADLPELARRISDRHRGVGSDGLILVCKPDPVAGGTGVPPVSPAAHVRMRMFNADGSESEMCGNGVRCVAKFAHDRLGVKANPMLVETGRGILSIKYELDDAGKLARASVNMGRPIVVAVDVPTTLKSNHPTGALIAAQWPALTTGDTEASDPKWQKACGLDPRVTAVSMGNPHAVLFCKDVSKVPLERIGPVLEHDSAFPRRVNVHFVQVDGRHKLAMRTWERGAGTTQACGTGACAVLVAAVMNGLAGDACDIDLPGGQLHVHWNRAGHDEFDVIMTGPAQDVFEGAWPD